MPRRYVDYLASDGFTTMNTISTIRSFLLGASTLPFVYNVIKSMKGPKVTADDPGLRPVSGMGRLPARRLGTTSLRCRGRRGADHRDQQVEHGHVTRQREDAAVARERSGPARRYSDFVAVRDIRRMATAANRPRPIA